jgi:hypothetical protein
MANSMRKRTSVSWLLIVFGPVAWLLAFAITARPSSRESVRAELIRLQGETGLTFGWIHDGVNAVSFKKRTVVVLKDSLSSFRPDDFSFSDHQYVFLTELCWSRDQSKLFAMKLESGNASLEVLNRESKLASVVAAKVTQESHLTSQCWSPDATQLVYEIEGSIRLYNTGKDSSVDLVKGTDASWSPDGDWIAFLDSGTYYAIQPDGNGRKKLFHKSNAVSALYWSPDSRIVAYVRELGFLQGGALDAEVNQLRVRRLADGSEDRLAPDSVDAVANYKWITSNELMKHSGSAPN